MITYWKMKYGKKIGQIRFLVPLAPCQIARVENEKKCELVQVLNSKHPDKIYLYALYVDGRKIKTIEHVKILNRVEKDDICREMAKHYGISHKGMEIKIL